jgi:hypothetical protein
MRRSESSTMRRGRSILGGGPAPRDARGASITDTRYSSIFTAATRADATTVDAAGPSRAGRFDNSRISARARDEVGVTVDGTRSALSLYGYTSGVRGCVFLYK